MKKKLSKGVLLSLIALSIAFIALLPSCKKVEYPLVSINPTLNITAYIESKPDQFSLWDQILQRTGYDGFLNAYGSYTVFVPNNDAVTAYLKSVNASSVSAISVDTLKDLVKFHVILGDTISTNFFIDGKIRSPTFLGQYLSSSVSNVNGVSSYNINSQALITQSNIALGNGVMHVIDHVLRPATLTLYQTLAANPKYSIFTAALVATGLKDSINTNALTNPNKNRNYFTVIAQSDSNYKALGIPDLATLKAKYATTNNSLNNPLDGFYAYVGYHLIPENDYLTDILSKTSHPTLSPTQDVITDVLQGQNIQLDYDNILGVQYPGVSVDRSKSNIPTTNGIIHSVNGDLFIKIFPPTRLDWDVADQPEFRKLTSVFRRAGQSSGTLNSPMTNISWSGTGTAQYQCSSTTSGTYWWWNDAINFANWRVTSGIPDATFITPTIIKGKYKMWFMYGRNSNIAGAQFFIDGAPMQNVLASFNPIYASPSDTGPVLEAKGFKRYTEAPFSATSNNNYNIQLGFMCGVVVIPTTDHHVLKCVAIGPASSNPMLIDMIQFIPVDQDQESPRYFRRDGTITN